MRCAMAFAQRNDYLEWRGPIAAHLGRDLTRQAT
jgi:hypothetical protein